MFHCDSKLPEDSDSAVIFQAIPTIGIDQLDPKKTWDFYGFFSKNNPPAIGLPHYGKPHLGSSNIIQKISKTLDGNGEKFLAPHCSHDMS
jgi:hypothetical protein